MEIHKYKNVKFDEYRIYVRNESKWFIYDIVHSADTKTSALRHLEELGDAYDIREYLVVGRTYKTNRDDVCDMKTFSKIKVKGK